MSHPASARCGGSRAAAREVAATREGGVGAEGAGRVVCADVGSTFTKAAVVELGSGALLGAASRPTTIGTDVLDGLAEAIEAAGGTGLPRLVCSSAGGGLRLAVVGYERLVTARAGAQVGLSAGARLVQVSSGPLDGAGIAALRAARPDVILLVGGTDGGDAEVLRHNAHRLGTARIRVPVVLAGNAAARDEVLRELSARRVPAIGTENVLPRIGVLNPGPARAAIREVFLRHVIGGKGLSRGPGFAALVRGATPDLVLSGVEVLAGTAGADLLVVDIGGATTDVYSVLTEDPEVRRGPRAAAAGTLWAGRSVEGDLGLRWGASGVVEAALAERLLSAEEADRLAPAAELRARQPGLLPGSVADWAVDVRLAALAATVAVRRHARADPAGGGGRDLRGVRLMIGSGGVLRHRAAGAPPDPAGVIFAAVLGDHAGGWALPRAADSMVDVDYVLAAAGLLAAEHPATAVALLQDRLLPVSDSSRR